MRTLFTTLAIGFAAALLSGPRAVSQDSAGWDDLLAHDLADWSRPQNDKKSWRITADRSLICTPDKELYIPERDFTDGTMKFEYRFRKTEKKSGYSAAFWARKTLVGSGCKVSLGDDCGTLTATYQGGSDRVKSYQKKPESSPAKAIGDWNEVTVTLAGRSVKVTINGTEIAGFDECDSARGLFALEVEGSEVEFRNVMWKEGK